MSCIQSELGVQKKIHHAICVHHLDLNQWFNSKAKDIFVPFYSSFDIRDAGFKISVVDANIFPAGFNNICEVDQESSKEFVDQFFEDHFSNSIKKVILLTEEHTNNFYYWDNVSALVELIRRKDRDVALVMPQALEKPIHVQSANGKDLEVTALHLLEKGGWEADLIISNNDFSKQYTQWLEQVKVPIHPPVRLGWHVRRKHHFFQFYNQLLEEFSNIIDVDPWFLQVETEPFSDFNIGDEKNRETLAQNVQRMIDRVNNEYRVRNIDQEPKVFIKNSSGTYGLGVTSVRSGKEVLEWNYKSKKKMKAVKGGGKLTDLILQEGIPSALSCECGVVEPVLYMIGHHLAGGFLRTHDKKGPLDSLNSPGAVFRRLCVSDLLVKTKDCPMENVYGWMAKIGLLAIGQEAQ